MKKYFSSAGAAFVLTLAYLFGFPANTYAAPLTLDNILNAETIPLGIGILLLLTALSLEWKGILNVLTLDYKTVAAIERMHPRFVTQRELHIALLLSATIAIFVIQLVINMYAMSYIPEHPVLTEYKNLKQAAGMEQSATIPL